MALKIHYCKDVKCFSYSIFSKFPFRAVDVDPAQINFPEMIVPFASPDLTLKYNIRFVYWYSFISHHLRTVPDSFEQNQVVQFSIVNKEIFSVKISYFNSTKYNMFLSF